MMTEFSERARVLANRCRLTLHTYPASSEREGPFVVVRNHKGKVLVSRRGKFEWLDAWLRGYEEGHAPRPRLMVRFQAPVYSNGSRPEPCEPRPVREEVLCVNCRKSFHETGLDPDGLCQVCRSHHDPWIFEEDDVNKGWPRRSWRPKTKTVDLVEPEELKGLPHVKDGRVVFYKPSV
jgi:hypothetical protein